MKRICVISDTHIPRVASDLSSEVYKCIMDVDFIFHAGDFVNNFLYEKLKNVGNLIAVKGNMDFKNIKSKLPDSQIVDIEGYKIGLTHGSGSPQETINNVKLRFTNKNLDLIIFGHTHTALKKIRNNTIFFNPGSVTDEVFGGYASFGMITLGEKIDANIIKIGD